MLNPPSESPVISSVPQTPFASFWMGGFEGADHVNGQGVALDMASSNGHIDRLDEDFRAAAAHGIRTVRESIGWRLAEPSPGQFDMARVHRIASSAQRHGVQVLWTLMHYGVPSDVRYTDDDFADRFACYAAKVAHALAAYADVPIYNMINEIGFLAWAVSETNLFHSYRGDPNNTGGRTVESGYAVKRRLVEAVLRGMAAVRDVDPRARFLHVEPIVHVVTPVGRPDLQPLADQIASYQWQVWDMIEGRADPELGGHRDALDIIGVNYYHNGQWEVETERRLEWHLRDERRRSLSDMLLINWQRYHRPLVITETSHFGAGRAVWLDEVMTEIRSAQRRGVAVDGVCLYPLIDRTDWDNSSHWHRSGLWDVGIDSDRKPNPDLELDPDDVSIGKTSSLDRHLCLEYSQALTRWQGQ